MNQLKMASPFQTQTEYWTGDPTAVSLDDNGIREKLHQLDQPCVLIRDGHGRVGATNALSGKQGIELEQLAVAPAVGAAQLGDAEFGRFHGTTLAYMTGAMANGIASEELVIALGRAGILGSFGAAGLVPSRVEAAIKRIQAALPHGPYAFNLIHSPSEENLERTAVELYLAHSVRTVEASAFLGLTAHIVRYRAAGLSRDAQTGEVVIANKVIAKISRREVATKFMEPAPQRLLDGLVAQGHISPEQAALARQVPMADDITVEADSGGHTDNRPLVCLLPSILALRDNIQAQYDYARPIRVGAGGGIGTPEAAVAAFMMGAAYIVTGSVNQACVEAGASTHTKKLLAQAGMADVMMAPAADMFEMGVKLQVLKRGTLFPMRAQKLYEIYEAHESIDDIPTAERQKLEKQVFQASLEEIWAGCVDFFNERDPEQLRRAENHPKRKMALIFRWYLGLSSRWSNTGAAGREFDYQIWCGPAMGAFNDWVRGSYLEQPENRHAVDVAEKLMTGAAYLYRLQALRLQGMVLDAQKFGFAI